LCEAREEKADWICQVLIKEMSESEPSDEASRRQNMLPKPRNVEFSGTRIAETYYWLFGNRRIGGMTFIWAYGWNAGSLTLM